MTSQSSTLSSASESVNSHILCAKYLERHSSKKDLTLRLRNIVQLLRQDENIEPDAIEFPGLAGLCDALLKFGDHRDKQVRLYTVSACMELFAIYAPDAPWSTEDTLDIFRQTIRQLANLAHTTSPSMTNFSDYCRILELLAQVKIGVLLVDLTKEEHSKDALQVLCELFRTLLQSVRLEHPPEIAEMAQTTICGCLEEYFEGVMLPVPLLDELLVCIGQGPTVLVINPQKAAQRQSKKQLPPHQVEQTNPSYVVASSVVRKTTERLSTPVATLLNGLLNNDSRLVAESSISTLPIKDLSQPQTQNQLSQADVWSIIYELHKIAPTILTTVIGTLANFLSVSDKSQREIVVCLLGKLWVKSPGRLALTFRPCFRDWLLRTKDVHVEIRLVMVDYLLQLIPIEISEISQEAQSMLSHSLADPNSEVRLKTVHGLCDVAYRHRTAIRLDLWQALGNRVSSKHKQERRDVLTGLTQTYYKHFMFKYLSDVQAGGDDCPLEVVQRVLSIPEDSRYQWIPTKLFECASWTEDTELNSRVLQIMDDLLLGSEMANSTKNMSPTARAAGLALLLDTIQPNAHSWMMLILMRRAKLQQALSKYLEMRVQIKSCDAGSEEALTAHAKAQGLLEQIAACTNLTTSQGEPNPVLEQFHAAKDKHIFRILSTIATPTHSVKARARALEELPKRVKALGEKASTWIKGLVRRCTMGDFINQEVVHHCILLAQECSLQEDWESCNKFLKCLLVAADAFPQICATPESFQTLIEMFSECRSMTKTKNNNLVTTISAILSKAAPSTAGVADGVDNNLQKQLLNLCCRDGTPEQAGHAVSTIAALIHPRRQGSTTQEQANSFNLLLNSLASPSRLILSSTKSSKLVSVLAALAELANCAPLVFASGRGQKAIQFALDKVLLRRHTHAVDGQEVSDQDQWEDQRAQTPTKRRKSTSSKKSSVGRVHLSPGPDVSILEDDTLSLSCRTLCAAIEFLVSYIRSSILASRSSPPSKFAPASDDEEKEDKDNFQVDVSSLTVSGKNHGVSSEVIEKVFDILCQILHDQGMPPSSQNRGECNMRQDRAALRRCAATKLLRLCDTRLSLDQTFLTPARWYTLSTAFLDDERVVRRNVIDELVMMLTGNGEYGKCHWASKAMAPRLRFLAFVVLCTDGDHGADHNGTNGNAANVGKQSFSTKTNASECIDSLRKTYEVFAAQARANGAEAERQFESQMKVMLMPEYVVPYAFHLLSFRRETPCVEEAHSKKTGSVQDNEQSGVKESQHRILRKRLKWLLDPLVHSLGDSADNISFLLRMTEVIDKSFMPVAFCLPRQNHSGLDSDDEDAPTRNGVDEESEGRESLKLKAVCSEARKVLLSYIKTDVNLATYPGTIRLPGRLFKRRHAPKKKGLESPSSNPSSNGSASGPSGSRLSGGDSFSQIRPDKSQVPIPASPRERSKRSSRGRIGHSLIGQSEDFSHRQMPSKEETESPMAAEVKTTKRESSQSPMPETGTTHGRVHFSPEVTIPELSDAPIRHSNVDFGNLSPIHSQLSPEGAKSPVVLLSSGEKTRGTTPPSIVRNTRFSASASFAIDASGTQSSNTSLEKSVNFSEQSGESTTRAGDEETMTTANSQLKEKENSGVTSSFRRKRSSPQKKQESIKRRRRAVPAQIKIARHKPILANRSTRSTSKNADILDFDCGPEPATRLRSKTKARGVQ